MKLRDVEFGNVFMSSGAMNNFGEGYWYDKYFRELFGLDCRGASYIPKTTTIHYNRGHMPLKDNLQPREFKPACIKIYFGKEMTLNSVGLSGLGAHYLIDQGIWQNQGSPKFLSFMAIAKTKELRLSETEEYRDLLLHHLPNFKGKIGLEVNISCPNTEHDPSLLAEEAIDYLQIFSKLEIPIVLKLNALVKIETVKKLADSDLVDAFTCTNTIPWGELPEKIDWQDLFGTTVSPLAKFGGGGLGGKPVFPVLVEWLDAYLKAGIDIPITAGGGIVCMDDIDIIKRMGGPIKAIELASVKLVAPWRVKGLIEYGNKLFGGQDDKHD